MNKDTVTKMYQKMSNKALATLSFHYSLESNGLETARIVDNVSRRDYTGLHIDFVRWEYRLVSLSSIFAIHYWRLQTARACTLGMLAHGLSTDNLATVKLNTEALRAEEAKLLALDNALVSVCKTYDIQIDDVRCYAEAQLFVPSIENLVTDITYQSDHISAFSLLLSDSYT